jgi:hypothetical protein
VLHPLGVKHLGLTGKTNGFSVQISALLRLGFPHFMERSGNF